MDKKPRGLRIPNWNLIRSIPYDTLVEEYSLESSMNIVSFMPPASDQLDQGSCVPFTLCYALVSYYEKRRRGYNYDVVNNVPNYSKVFSPAFVFNSIKRQQSGQNCKTGIDFISAFDFIKQNGTSIWNVFPYIGAAGDCSVYPPAIVFSNAKNYIGYKFYRITSGLQSIKNYLNAGIPIVIGLYSSKDMDIEGYAHKDTVNPFFWKPQRNDLDEYHSMLCAGYDDKLGCFILLNSWGFDWGNRGYCYVPYNIFFERAREFYVAKISKPEFLLESLKILDNHFNDIITTHIDSLEFKPKRDADYNDALVKQFKEDLFFLKSMKEKKKEHIALINEIEDYLKTSN